MERVTGGRIFRPSSKLRNKYWFEAIVTAFIFWIVTIVTFFGMIYFIFSLEGNPGQYEAWLAWIWGPVNTWFWVANLAWLIPALIFIPIYLNSFEYSVRAPGGEASAEVYVKKGIITKTEKHVPMKMITNVATKVGVLDRVFGIGCVEIETAGYSGAYQEGPEEKISGISFYNELRDYILAEMRRFRGALPGVEAEDTFEEPIARIASSRDDEILDTLRDMKELLRSIDRKLDKER
jgi:membrane protein YdbS with pleckstrin-like domain